ncbi:hypothetical protein LZ30DRAFT_742673 [Colletotrichum cereale]|nr:hypothetical protein LZ30DRAFT_742673 [Colletotrichum cereale]
MKLLAVVAYGAAVVSCFPNPMIPNTKAADAPSSNATSFLQPRAPNQLYGQAVTAAREAGVSLEPNQYHYFMACGQGHNTWAEFSNGINLIRTRPRPNGRMTADRAREDQQAWEYSQSQVKGYTGCDHVGFLVGEVAKSGWVGENLVFKGQLHYVVPNSSPARWLRKTLTTAEIPGSLT